MNGSIDAATAEAVARATIDGIGEPGSMALLPQYTQRAGDGGVFFYTSIAYPRTGEPGERLAGDGPVFVSATGAVTKLPTHKPWQESIPTDPRSQP